MSDVVSNLGWSDAARAASLAVRQAKVVARRAARAFGHAIGWDEEQSLLDQSERDYARSYAAQKAAAARERAAEAKRQKVDEFTAMREFFSKFPGANMKDWRREKRKRELAGPQYANRGVAGDGRDGRDRKDQRGFAGANLVILNRDFALPGDGWYQIAPFGEFPNAAAGVVQVIDRAACEAMAARFGQEAAVANFAGVLIDFDHFSLDAGKRSEAAGWVTALDVRDAGLFANIRWSDVGENAVKGGRYRFISPVWARADCEDLGGGRVRPMRLLNAAVTNDPNLKGMVPLSNSATTAGGEKRFKWTLGDGDRHCPSCGGLAGQVHTMAEWDAAGVTPGCAALFCGGNCQCTLVETTDAAAGVLGNAVKREGAGMNGNTMANTGWTDAARAASLAVRQAKAAARKAASGSGSTPITTKDQSDDNIGWFEREGIVAMTDSAIAKLNKELRAKEKAGKALDDTEKAFLGEVAKELARRALDTLRKQKKATSGVAERAGGSGRFDEKTGQTHRSPPWAPPRRRVPAPGRVRDL